MTEWTAQKVADSFDAAGAFLREFLMQYPILVSILGGVLLGLVILNLVIKPLRIAWWRISIWRARVAGKVMHWSYDSDVADAIVSITNRYWTSGRMSSKQRKEKLRILAQALNLPELHQERKYRSLHPYLLAQLRAKTVNALGGAERAAQKLITAKANKARPKVKLTIVNGTKAA
ncbi:MAG TPA: hypothetical protein VGJ00_03885 [Rhabdochlamydiaceae bacterium]|jgi:hypothetical protein